MPRRQASPAEAGSLTTVERVDAVLLGQGVVVVEPSRAGRGPRPGTTGDIDGDVMALEADTAARGHLLQADLRAALAALPPDELRSRRSALVAGLDTLLGADRPHVPLFRRFPFSTPRDTERLWVERVLVALFQEPDQPCVLCGTVGSVRAVDPCAHLVCDVCFDGSDYSACPVCRRRLDPDDPFLRPTPPRGGGPATKRGPFRLLRLAASRDAAALTELHRLLARSVAPSSADLEAVEALVDHRVALRGSDLGWLPTDIPARTAKATVLARLITHREIHDAAAGALLARCDTATDVLRVAAVLTGGAADLTPSLERTRNLPRPVRRALLTALDSVPVDTAAEDVLRHVAAWKKVAERLHPFEHARRLPRAALVVAVVRGTRLSSLDPGLRALLEREVAEHPDTLEVDRDRLRVRTFAGAVEHALREGDVDAALRLLAGRPGELVRRLDHLLRLATASTSPGPGTVGAVLDAARRTVPRVAPAVLLSARAELARRTAADERRVFFPRGRIASMHAAADLRAPLPATVVADACSLIEEELLARAAALPPYEVAVLDAGLAAVPAPFTARTTARTLVDLPRGTVLPLPTGDVLRLFLHWTEPTSTRVDLDLSVAMFDAGWAFVGLCDYTAMRFYGTAAVHSGDLTSAPGPLGATEFVDLDLLELAQTGVTYAVPVVFSYNDVPFDQLDDAFAGVMVRSAEAARVDEHFDAATVEQRFDLAGEARIAVPMVLDLAESRLCWLDMNLGASGYGHHVRGYASSLAELGRSLLDHYASGARTTLWQVAAWHAAARAEVVLVRRPDVVHVHRRRPAESTSAFVRRLAGAGEPEEVRPDLPALDASTPVLAALIQDDVELPPGSAAYALLPSRASADVARVGAADLVSALKVRAERQAG